MSNLKVLSFGAGNSNRRLRALAFFPERRRRMENWNPPKEKRHWLSELAVLVMLPTSRGHLLLQLISRQPRTVVETVATLEGGLYGTWAS